MSSSSKAGLAGCERVRLGILKAFSHCIFKFKFTSRSTSTERLPTICDFILCEMILIPAKMNEFSLAKLPNSLEQH